MHHSGYETYENEYSLTGDKLANGLAKETTQRDHGRWETNYGEIQKNDI